MVLKSNNTKSGFATALIIIQNRLIFSQIKILSPARSQTPAPKCSGRKYE